LGQDNSISSFEFSNTDFGIRMPVRVIKNTIVYGFKLAASQGSKLIENKTVNKKGKANKLLAEALIKR